MKQMPPPFDSAVSYVDGYYWIQNLTLGSLSVMLRKDGRWHHWAQGEEMGVVEGPLPMPTEAPVAAWKADYAVEEARQRAEFSHVADPSWFDWLDGYYWVQFDDEEPEIAFVMEDSWQSLMFVGDDVEWGSDPALEEPQDIPVLVGPLVQPVLGRRLQS